MLRPRVLVILVAGTLCCAATVHAAVTVDREFRYDSQRVKLTQREGYSYVAAHRAMRELTAGHPDLPWISEQVEIPADMQVTNVELVEVATEVMSRGAHLPAAEVKHPGLGPIERYKPAAAHVNAAG